MLSRALFVLALILPVAARAQCTGLASYTGFGGSFTTGVQPTAADLNCMTNWLKSEVLPRTGGVVTGAFEATPTGNPVPAGDNIDTLDFRGGRVNILRRLSKAVTNTPNLVVNLDNDSPIPRAGYGLYPQLAAEIVQAQGLASGTAGLTAGLFLLNLHGNHPWTAEDVALQSTINQYGSDSAWLFDGFARDLTGLPPKDFSQVGAEYDMAANGPDTPIAAYDPLHAYRYFISLNPSEQPWPGWKPHTAYRTAVPNQPGAVIREPDVAGVPSIYVATVAGTERHDTAALSRQWDCHRRRCCLDLRAACGSRIWARHLARQRLWRRQTR